MPGAYLDHNATTPLDPRVLAAMLPWLEGRPGNPSSVHVFGRKASAALETAREQVAGLLGARPLEVIFTASGTEANNAALASGLERTGEGRHLVVSGLEHSSVMAAASRMANRGVEVTVVPPRGDGRVDPGDFLDAVRAETSLACLMLANNEIGTLQPVAEVAAVCRERGVKFHCDAVQAVGKIGVDVEELGADTLSLGAHKFYGPLGAAALWVRRGTPFEALIVGGSHERRRRAGTPDLPAIVGLGKAARIAADELDERSCRLAELRDRLERGVDEISGTSVHGRAVPRLPNTTSVAVAGIDAEALMARLDMAGYAVSTGAACSSGTAAPSPALLALGLSRSAALSSLRISLGLGNTPEEVDGFLTTLAEQVAELRSLSAGRPNAPREVPRP